MGREESRAASLPPESYLLPNMAGLVHRPPEFFQQVCHLHRGDR